MDHAIQNPFCKISHVRNQGYVYEIEQRVGGTHEIPLHKATKKPETEDKTPRAVEDVYLKLAFFTDAIQQLQEDYTESMEMRHLTLVGVDERFISNHRLCIVFSHKDPGNLQSLLESTSPSGFDELYLTVALRSTLTALVILHANGRVHKAIKAKNVLLHTRYHINDIDAEFVIKLTYGATLFSNQDGPYPPPEIENSGYTLKSDIWSLGIMALELGYGIEFSGKDVVGLKKMVKYVQETKSLPVKNHDHALPTLKEKLFKHSSVKKEMGPFSSNMEKLVVRCLKEKPNKRPTAQQLLEFDIFQ